MKALIVYDSVFGNTGKIAQAMGKALGLPESDVIRVNQAKAEQIDGLELLIVGSPTRGFNATRPLYDFLKSLPANKLKGIRVAAFDTRVSVETVKSALLTSLVKFFGYAAEKIAKRLQKKGGKLISTPEGFFVDDREGPITQGELERAAEWVKKIANSL